MTAYSKKRIVRRLTPMQRRCRDPHWEEDFNKLQSFAQAHLDVDCSLEFMEDLPEGLHSKGVGFNDNWYSADLRMTRRHKPLKGCDDRVSFGVAEIAHEVAHAVLEHPLDVDLAVMEDPLMLAWERQLLLNIDASRKGMRRMWSYQATTCGVLNPHKGFSEYSAGHRRRVLREGLDELKKIGLVSEEGLVQNKRMPATHCKGGPQSWHVRKVYRG